MLILGIFKKLSLLLKICLYVDTKVYYMLRHHLIYYLSFHLFLFADVITTVLGYPFENLDDFLLKLYLGFHSFFYWVPSFYLNVFLGSFMKLWRMSDSFILWFCAFLTLSISSSLDECLKLAVDVCKVLVFFLSGSKPSCLDLDRHDL